jgi:ABC-type cobalamin/Fe3+-siderophores transport system ATPase subunit
MESRSTRLPRQALGPHWFFRGSELELFARELPTVTCQVDWTTSFATSMGPARARPRAGNMMILEEGVDVKRGDVREWWTLSSGRCRGSVSRVSDRSFTSMTSSHAADFRRSTADCARSGSAIMAIALVNRPPLVLLDEPTTGADVRTRAQLLHLARELANEVRLTAHVVKVNALAVSRI